MTAVVRFRAGGGDWALDVRDARQVLGAGSLRPLARPREDVVGLLDVPGEPVPLPVLASLGSGPDGHVLVVEARGHRFGLLVDEVTGVLRDEDVRLGPPPAGRDVSGVRATIILDGGSALLLDAGSLADRL